MTDKAKVVKLVGRLTRLTNSGELIWDKSKVGDETGFTTTYKNHNLLIRQPVGTHLSLTHNGQEIYTWNNLSGFDRLISAIEKSFDDGYDELASNALDFLLRDWGRGKSNAVRKARSA